MQTFIHDFGPKRALRGIVYRSPFRKGKITDLRVPALPKGYSCVQARDIPGKSVLSCAGYSLPVLAKSEVRYMGEPLILFCGPDPEVLAEVCAAVELKLEEESPIEYKDLSGPYREGQIINVAHGDVDLAFSLADQIVEGEYRTARQEHFYPDTQGAVADWDGKNLSLYAATQDPFGLRSAICRCLDLAPRKVRVVAVPVGNSMEGKLLSSYLVAAQAALLAHNSVKPIVLIYNWEEDLLCSPKRPGFLIRQHTALDREGGAMAVRVQIFMDGGCYPPKDCEALRQAVHSAWGAYRVPNMEVTGRILVTDFPPIGSFRASGRAQAIFAAELHSSRLEEIAQLDPYTWKKENLVGRNEGRNNGHDLMALAVLEEATRVSDFTRKYSAYSAVKKRLKTIDQAAYPLRGIGLSLASQDAEGIWECLHTSEETRNTCTLKLVLERGKRVRIFTSFVDCGMGIHALFIYRAAQLLDLDPSKISVQPVDTQEVPDTGPTTLARAVTVGLPLLEQCCKKLQKKRKTSSAPIEIRRSFPLDKLRLPGRGKDKLKDGRAESAWAATVVEVELDPVSYQSICRGVWLVVEAGTIVQRKSTVQILEGETLRALGSSQLQEYRGTINDGQKLCSNAELILGAEQVPEIQLHLIETQEGPMKGYEQLPHLGVPPAYAAAVCQATGLYVDQVPITAEVIQQCLEM
jgi:CO/xanthine dehydrogenase Mo-binding subunit